MELPEKIQNNVRHFTRLPGVGEKTALRQTLIMTKWSKEELVQFSEAVKALSEIEHCPICGMYSDNSLCKICTDPARAESHTLCLVESVTDCLAILRSGTFKGKFHILFGVLNPLLGIGPDELNFKSLFQRIKSEKISNIILAINPSVEGDATCAFIKDSIDANINVERIGFGIPMGGSLEFVDALTISKAIENRRNL